VLIRLQDDTYHIKALTQSEAGLNGSRNRIVADNRIQIENSKRKKLSYAFNPQKAIHRLSTTPSNQRIAGIGKSAPIDDAISALGDPPSAIIADEVVGLMIVV
jgi:rhamnose utilization protein RhaD (predicted bifunctional aldolase and dehydrogenase)